MPELRPSLWPRSAVEAQLKRSLDACNKKNKALQALVVRLSEMILQHITGKT